MKCRTAGDTTESLRTRVPTVRGGPSATSGTTVRQRAHSGRCAICRGSRPTKSPEPTRVCRASGALTTAPTGAVAASHTPTIGFAHDAAKQTDPVGAPIFGAFLPSRQWLAEQKPDALVVVYNDHISAFFLDHGSGFSLGVGERWEVADEGGGVCGIPGINGHPALAAHIGQSVMADSFDLSYFQGRPLDHRCFSPLSVLLPHNVQGWPLPIIPLQIGVLQYPMPTARRCFGLGKALRRASESYTDNLRVAQVATGGVSRQVHGERCGFNKLPWGQQFLAMIEKDPERLADRRRPSWPTSAAWRGRR